MSSTIAFDLSQVAAFQSVPVLPTGKITVRPLRRTATDELVLLTTEYLMPIVDGIGVEYVTVDGETTAEPASLELPTETTTYWQMTGKFPGVRNATDYFVIPDGSTLTYGELLNPDNDYRIDPATLDPEAPLDPAWMSSLAAEAASRAAADVVLTNAVEGIVFQTAAVADGTTDDTAAIHAAITLAAAASAFGATVQLPPGTCLTTTGITLPANVNLRGTGPRSSRLQGAGATTTLTVGSNCTVTDLNVRGDATAGGKGIAATNGAHHWSLTDVWVTNQDDGVYLTNTYIVSLTRTVIQSCTTGLRLTGANVNAITVLAGEIQGCVDGVYADTSTASNKVTFYSVTIEGNSGYGMHNAGFPYAWSLRDCYFEANVTGSIYSTVATRALLISGCTFSGETGWAIKMTAGVDTTIEACVFTQDTPAKSIDCGASVARTTVARNYYGAGREFVPSTDYLGTGLLWLDRSLSIPAATLDDTTLTGATTFETITGRRSDDTFDRVQIETLDGAGRITLGTGGSDPEAYITAGGATEFRVNGSLNFVTDNTFDVGASPRKPRNVNAATDVTAARGLRPGSFTTATRPSLSGPNVGTVVWDSDLNQPIWWDGTTWQTISPAVTTALALKATKPTAWASLLVGGNAKFTAGTDVPQYREFEGWVEITGKITVTGGAGVTAGDVVAVLPAGFRPVDASRVLVFYNPTAAITRLNIATSGNITIPATGGTITEIDLVGQRFRHV